MSDFSKEKLEFIVGLSNVYDKLSNDKYYDAIDLGLKLLDKYKDFYKEDCYTFNNGIEYYLFLVDFEKKIEKQDLRFDNLFSYLGTSYMLIGKYVDARAYLKKALDINPYDYETRFKYSETFRLNNELEEYFKVSVDSLKYCYKAIAFQRFYRNISEYYFRYENYMDSLYMMIMAKYVYEDNTEIINPEIFRIKDCVNNHHNPTIDAIIDYMNNKDILTPSLAIDKLKYIYLKIKDSDITCSTDILSILYELTNDETYSNLIEEYNKKIEELSSKINEQKA